MDYGLLVWIAESHKRWHVVITNSFQNQNSTGKIQTGAEQARTSKKIGGRIMCHRGVNILCWPVTTAECFVVIGKKTETTLDNYVINDGLTINMKNVSHHANQCIRWQGRCTCLDHKTIKKMTSDETVDSFINLFVSNLPRRKNCSYVEHAVAYWTTERQKLHMCVMKLFLHKPGKVTREKLKSSSLSWSFFCVRLTPMPHSIKISKCETDDAESVVYFI